MQVSLTIVLVFVFMLMLAVLGHGVWHHGEIAFANIIVSLFTGGHVTG